MAFGRKVTRRVWHALARGPSFDRHLRVANYGRSQFYKARTCAPTIRLLHMDAHEPHVRELFATPADHLPVCNEYSLGKSTLEGHVMRAVR
jgi:hypothetical protein